MTFDYSWTLTLNKWGASYPALIEFLGNTLVYILLLLGALFILQQNYSKHSGTFTVAKFCRSLISDGILNYSIPLGISVIFSEGISAVINRARPFVTHKDIHLLFPHSADGGMPSHHVLFMVALAACVMHSNKKIGVLFLILAAISGIARVAAGIHYPSDIAVGGIVGFALVFLYQKTLPKVNFLHKYP